VKFSSPFVALLLLLIYATAAYPQSVMPADSPMEAPEKFAKKSISPHSEAGIADPQDHGDLTGHLQELRTMGFTVIEDVFTQEEMALLAEQFAQIKKRAFQIMESTPPHPRFFRENNRDHRSIYWKTDRELILQGGEGRYDFYRGFQEGIFGSDAVLHNPLLDRVMRHLLIDEFTNYSGVILSCQGSEDQYWHRDTHTLANFGTDGSKLVQMDDFYFTILIPITVPFTLENGTTELLAGSHKMSSYHFDKCQPMQRKVPLGSALVFNGKINHRGRANASDEDRPTLYIVYHKKWYNSQYLPGIPE
jgi:hypothetical protein